MALTGTFPASASGLDFISFVLYLPQAKPLLELVTKIAPVLQNYQEVAMIKNRSGFVVLVSFLVLVTAGPSLAATPPNQPQQKDPLVIGILKLVLPLGETLLGKIFPAGGKDKMKKDEVKAALSKVTGELQGKKRDLDQFVEALNEWRGQRIALPLCRLFASYVQEDLQIAAASDYDKRVVEEVWTRLVRNIQTLNVNLPNAPVVKANSEIVGIQEQAKLDSLVLELRRKAGDLNALIIENHKESSLKNMLPVAKDIVDLLTNSYKDENVVADIVASAYSDFSRAIGATSKGQMAKATAQPASPGPQRPSLSSDYAFALENPMFYAEAYAFSSADQQKLDLLKKAVGERNADRAEILKAVRATGPEHALPYDILGFVAGALGAATGFFGKNPFLQLLRKLSGGRHIGPTPMPT